MKIWNMNCTREMMLCIRHKYFFENSSNATNILSDTFKHYIIYKRFDKMEFMKERKCDFCKSNKTELVESVLYFPRIVCFFYENICSFL